jgi:UTP--glucose-1-phosphate uridylyltransferase
MSVRGLKAVLTAGGVGTRLLPFSKEIPKEMSPIIARDPEGSVQVKPVIQAIYEQLYNEGIRDFLVVVGRGKRAIQDHFTPDQAFLEFLSKNGKGSNGLTEFYQKVKLSNIVFISQPEPLGFGDAVLRARPYINGRFLVHAGDTFILSADYLARLAKVHTAYDADVTILLQDVLDPRQYGVVVGEDLGDGIMKVASAEEKPAKPKSKTAITAIYLFKETVFPLLASATPGKNGEIQLTDAIQSLCLSGRVMGLKLRNDELRLDIGSPETLMEALQLSSKYMEKKTVEKRTNS